MVEYVTKQTVIDELSRYGMTEDGEAIINAIPAADVVEVATTSWEDIERIGFGSFEATCQHCKRRMMYMAWWKYCPECGAKVEDNNG